MSTIQEVLSELQTVSEEANQPLMSIPMNIRSGIEGRIRAAQAKLPMLKQKYERMVVDNAVFVPVTGSAAKEFALAAQEYLGAFSANYDELTNNIYQSLEKRMYTSVYSTNTYSAFLTELQSLKGQLGIERLSVVPFNNSTQNTDVRTIIKQDLDSFYGSELNMLYIKKQLGEYALSEGFAGGKLPVIVYGYEGTNYARFIKTTKELTINKINEKQSITTEEVIEILNKIKKEIL